MSKCCFNNFDGILLVVVAFLGFNDLTSCSTSAKVTFVKLKIYELTFS